MAERIHLGTLPKAETLALAATMAALGLQWALFHWTGALSLLCLAYTAVFVPMGIYYLMLNEHNRGYFVMWPCVGTIGAVLSCIPLLVVSYASSLIMIELIAYAWIALVGFLSSMALLWLFEKAVD